MAANEYVQAAASQLNNAATAVKMEADQMRADLARLERDISSSISSNDSEMHAMSARATSQNDPQAAAHWVAQAARIKSQNDNLKKELEQKRSELTQAIKNKENAMSTLKSQASGLQRQAGNF